MQPVQYRGYAQGTAFNPIILSDQSRKILEENEQFLRGLQAKQRIERDVEVAKLKELQRNIESQRQQLNENYRYDQRQRDRYNQSLQDNAAREIQDLKRIAAIQPDKPTTAQFVNDVANSFISLSKTAGEVIGAVREYRDVADTQEAQKLRRAGPDFINDYIEAEIGDTIVLQTYEAKLAETEGEVAAHSIDGREFEAGQKSVTVKSGVRAKLILQEAAASADSFTLRYQAQESPELLQATTEQRLAAYDQSQQQTLAPYLDKGLSDARLAPIREKMASERAKFEASLYKLDLSRNRSELVLMRRQEAILNPSPANLHSLLQSQILYHDGNKVKGYSDFEQVLTDLRIPDSAVRDFSKTTFYDQKGNKQIFALRNDDALAQILSKRAEKKGKAVDIYDKELTFKDKQAAAGLRTQMDQYLADDGQITNDEVTHQNLAAVAEKFDSLGLKDAAKTARQYIRATKSFEEQELAKELLDLKYANLDLTVEDVRNSGVRGSVFVEYMEKANEVGVKLEPSQDHMRFLAQYALGGIKSRIGADLLLDTTNKLPREALLAVDLAKENMITVYKETMLESGGNRREARKQAIASFEADLGTDIKTGLYGIENNIQAYQNLRNKNEQVRIFKSDFVIKGADYIDRTQFGPRLERQIEQYKLNNPGNPEGVLKDIVDETRLSEVMRAYNQTGRITKDPGLVEASKLLGIPYVEAHNKAVELLELNDNLKFSDELYKTASEIERAGRSTSWSKFLSTLSNLDPLVVSEATMAEIAGGPSVWAQPQQMSPVAYAQTIDYNNVTNPVGRALVDMALRNRWDPIDIASIIGYETGGTFDINQPGLGAAAGRVGWIQAGEEERLTYGLGSGDPISEIAAIEKYLIDRGAKPGHSLADLYSAVNNGRASLGWNPDGNGVIPRDPKTLKNIRSHRENAAKYFGFN